MTGKRPALLVLLLALNILFNCESLFSAEKATDLMSVALKNKAVGKIGLAIEQLQKAVELSNNSVEKNLALFMLGDCQLESGKNKNAAQTFQQLRESVVNEEERAEATFRLLQAESYSGDKKKADRLFRDLKQNHKKSPYYELAKAFVQAQGLANATETSEPETKIAIVSKPENTKVVEKIQKNEEPTEPLKVEQSPRPEQVQKIEEKPAQKKPEKLVAKAASDDLASKSNTRAISGETATLLKEALTINLVEDKDELVAQILVLQDKLKEGPQKKGMDQTLFELAALTTQFGESVEACKLYDQLLSLHPSSPYVEEAYYEAIRLRAVLGVHDAVVSWAKAFLAAFPASSYGEKVKALLLYSENHGKIDISMGKAPAKKAKVAKFPSGPDDSDKLKTDSDYIQASRKIKESKYNLALIDLKAIAKKYPQASQVWWDMALVYVQFEDFPAAEGAVMKMLEINPGSEEGNSLLGYIHYRLENYQQAANAYGKAGEPDGKGVTFFDAKSAAERMKKSVGSK